MHGRLVKRKSEEGKEKFGIEVKKEIKEGGEWEVIN